jgi:tripartite-type tricarboxylate transporter receptor subunit TctC
MRSHSGCEVPPSGRFKTSGRARHGAIVDPALKEAFGALGAETELISPREFADRFRSDFDRWSTVIKHAGISAQ